VITRERGFLTIRDLPDEIYNGKHSDDQFVVGVGTKLDSVDQELIRRTLEATGGNRRRAADMLGVPRRTFYVMLNKNGLHPRGRKPSGSGGHNSRT
jgi:transcriptional regulator of acetoin/glycerol metabolism